MYLSLYLLYVVCLIGGVQGGVAPLLGSFLLSDLALKSYDSKTFRSRAGEKVRSWLYRIP